jgi:hypothetical protein
MTVSNSLHSLLDYECLLFFMTDLRVGHLFTFHCPLVNTPQLNTRLLMNELQWNTRLLMNELELNLWNLLTWTELSNDGSLLNKLLTNSFITLGQI